MDGQNHLCHTSSDTYPKAFPRQCSVVKSESESSSLIHSRKQLKRIWNLSSSLVNKKVKEKF
jgi:hypothetical protein